MTDYSSIEVLHSPSEQTIDLASNVWKRFRRHRAAIGGMAILSVIVLLSLFAFLSPYDPVKSNLPERFRPPSASHPMGTDALGRDLFTRILYGGRISLTVGLSAVAISLVIGVPVGALAGYYGGRTDSVLMRFTDAFLSLPPFLVLILLAAILREVQLPLVQRNSVLTISIVIGILSWMTFSRLVRAAFLTLRELDYVSASRALGSSDRRIILGHILPNGIGVIIVEATLQFGYVIILEAGLSFLGFGIQQPTPSWGNLINSAQDHFINYPWLAIFPGLMIFLTIISVNYIGDGLRDAFDPYKVLESVGEYT
ncbi:MAG TPA: ABC transporter permease [Anaerolineales bacterium]|nr:ABC transporter permease [Anaerolineales bacterium]